MPAYRYAPLDGIDEDISPPKQRGRKSKSWWGFAGANHVQYLSGELAMNCPLTAPFLLVPSFPPSHFLYLDFAFAAIAILALIAATLYYLKPLTDEQIRVQCRKAIGPRKVHVVLPATNASPRFCRSLSTLLIHDYEPVIINWQGSKHHSAKIHSLLDYLEKHTSALFEKQQFDPTSPPQCQDERGDIVVSLDANDVFTQRPLESVLAEFEKMPERIVYSAEKGCHPLGEAWCSQVNDGPLPSNFYGPQTDNLKDLPHSRARFLNSGFVIGFAKDLHTLYTEAAQQAKLREGHFKADQSIFGPIFVSGRHNMTLDYKGAMATPIFFFELEVGFQPTPIALQAPATNSRYIRDETVWNQFNRVTNQFPAFVHYNGPKDWMDRDWKKTWWGGGQGTPVMERINTALNQNVTIARDTGELLSFREMCPGSWQIPVMKHP
jgi:hypothetical protein